MKNWMGNWAVGALLGVNNIGEYRDRNLTHEKVKQK
jgi:hypothetical protein